MPNIRPKEMDVVRTRWRRESWADAQGFMDGSRFGKLGAVALACWELNDW
jgi:hypothetical protein